MYIEIAKRVTNKSIGFKKSNAYLLKNRYYSIMVPCFTIEKSRNGIHHHYDFGQFILSYLGKEIIIDSGSSCYTSSFEERNKYRAISSHNCPQCNINYPKKIWKFHNYISHKNIEFNPKENTLNIRYNIGKNYVEILYTLKDNCFKISYNHQNVHLTINPQVEVIIQKDKVFLDKLLLKGHWSDLYYEDVNYSPSYGKREITKRIYIKTIEEMSIILKK